MRLADIASSDVSVPFVDLGGFRDLVLELQGLMADLGILDPPVDGKFGQVSRWALAETLKLLGQAGKTAIDQEAARKLLASVGAGPLALKPKADYAGKLTKFMMSRNYWINRHPDCLNIVYVEGADPDGTPREDIPNQFNDVRLLLRVAQPSGTPEIVAAWEATAAPGRFYVEHPLDPKGAAHIALGQFKAWTVGLHGTGAGRHEALVQSDVVTVYRDANRDYSRIGDVPYSGLFGINQHWGYDLPRTDIQNASAGCLVGRLKSGHRDFMKRVKEDVRFQQNSGYLFMTTIVAREDF